MKRRFFPTWLEVSVFLILNAVPLLAGPLPSQGTAFNYQGQLLVNSTAVTGDYDMQFTLYYDGTTNLVTTPIVNPSVGVTNGLFNVTLDFGNVFSGYAMDLGIAVRPTGSTSNYTALTPAQPINSVPYAVRALNATTFVGAIGDSQLSTNIVKFNTGGGFTAPVVFSNASGNFSGTFTGTNYGLFFGTTSGTNTGTFIGNGAGVTNVNVTNLVGIVQSNPNWQLLQSSGQTAVVGNNYFSTNAALLSLNLPGSPGIGSIIRVSGSGANGWTVVPNGSQTIITANLGLPAGQTWTPVGTSTPGPQSWHAVAASADGMKLAAAYGTGYIYYSNDGGQTWTKSDAPSLNWAGIASSADGKRMVAVPNGGYPYTSVDGGTNWTSQLASFSQAIYWTSVASSADGINLVAGSSGAGSVYTSSNGGTNWTKTSAGPVGGVAWSAVASSSNGAHLVAVASGSAQVYVSSNSGVTWTNAGPANSWSSVASSADGNHLVASVSTGYLYTSGDGGMTWTPHASSQAWKCVTSSGDGMNLAAAYSSGYLYTSSDSGQTWVQRTNGVPTGAQAWNCIASSSTGSRLLAAISTGYLYTSVASTSASGGSLSGTQFSSVELQYIGNGQWMPLTYTGSFTGN